MTLDKLVEASNIPADVADAYSDAVRRYLPREDVVGVSIGPKVVGDEIDWDTRVVHVRVREKVDPELLDPAALIPRTINDVPTDILEGASLPDSWRTMRAPSATTDLGLTISPGVSIGVPGGGAGTLGLFVKHPTGGRCILTAHHVLSATGHGGDPRVFQPAPDDAPIDGRDPIARVFKSLPAAGVGIARVDTSRPVTLRPLGARKKLTGVRLPRIGDVLMKSGRTTGVTAARVTRFGAFKNCKPGIELQPVDGDPTEEISMGGDSGAVWYDPETYEAVAVHCRGDGDGDLKQEWAQAVVLDAVMEGLEIELA